MYKVVINLEADGEGTRKHPLYVGYTPYIVLSISASRFLINQCQRSVHPALTQLYLYECIRMFIKQHYVHSRDSFGQF